MKRRAEVFEHLGIKSYLGEQSLELEFKKATYKHKFDRSWYSEVLALENQCMAHMGAILERTKAKTTGFEKSPLELSTDPAEYAFNFDLSFAKNISDECLALFSVKFRLKYGQIPSDMDI